jgi:hypothetical protein
MKKMLTFFLFLTTLIVAFGSEQTNLKRYVLSDAIVQKEPAPEREMFYLGERAIFFTEFTDVEMEEEVVYHNWYFINGDGIKKITASVPLKIRGQRWRTWSSKNLFIKGNWKVELTDKNENILAYKNFTVE